MRRSFKFAIALVAVSNFAPLAGQTQELAPLQGEWSSGDPTSYLFRVEGDKVHIVRHANNRPEMKIVKILAEGLKVNEVKEDEKSLTIKGQGAICYQSPDGIKINSSSAGCGFTFFRNKAFGVEMLSGFGIVSGNRPAK